MSNNNNNNEPRKSTKTKKVVSINIQKYNFKEFEKEQLPYIQVCKKVADECTNPFAGFIWLYLQGKPDTWIPCKWEIMKRFDISEATYKRHMRYLSSCNLIEYHQIRNEDGTVGASRLVVLNGTKFNSTADKYRGIIFDATNEPVDNFDDTDRSIKNDTAVDPASIAGSDRGIKNDTAEFNRSIKKPPTGEMNPHINNIYNTNNEISHTQENEEEFFLEKTLFLDSEQQRKAMVFRSLCLKDQKAKDKHASIKTEKSYTEMLDECISHYATQLEPQLVSPQRFQSWIDRESRFQKTEAMKGAKYPTANDRAANELKIREREIKAQEDKRKEVQGSKSIGDLLSQPRPINVDLDKIEKEQEEERKKIGMTAFEYHRHLISKMQNEKRSVPITEKENK